MKNRLKHIALRCQHMLVALGFMLVVFVGVPMAHGQTLDALIRAQRDVSLEIPPTTIVFDFYLSDQFKGEVLMTYTDQWGKFHDPEGVLDMMPEITNRDAVFDLINHGEIMGLEREIEGVGRVQINPSNFQAQLTLEPAVLDTAKNFQAKVDVEPSKRLKLSNNFGVVLNNSLEGEGFQGTLSHRNYLSFGRSRLEFRGSYSDSNGAGGAGANDVQGYDFEDVLAAYEQDETLYEIGALQTRGLEFARQQDIMGVRVGANIETQFDNSGIYGEIVTVFIPARSNVRAFADGRLVYTDTLDFGLQELDTSSFPQGSYDLRIEITEQATGRTTTENQFFTKTNRLVPFGRPDWDVILGFARDELDPNTAEPVWQARIRNRFAGNYEVGAALLGGKGLNIFEPQVRTFWKDLELRGRLSVTDGGDVAVSGFGQFLGGDKYGTLTARMRRTIAGHDTTPQTGTDVFDPLLGHTNLMSASWTQTFARISLTLRGTRTQSEGGPSNFSWGPSIRYPILSGGQQRLDLRADYVFLQDRADTYGGFLNYTYTPTPSPWQVRTETSHRGGGSGGAQTTNLSQLEFDNRTSTQAPGTEILLTNTVTKSQTEDDFIGQDMRLRHTTTLFDATLNASHGRSGGDSTGNIGFSANTNFVLDGGKGRLVGGVVGGASLVIDLTGSAKGETMKVMDGTRTIGRAKVGERTTIGLQPFQTYNITLSPEEDDALVNYDTSTRTFKLINQAVEVASFEVNKVLLVFGRLIDPSGEPLAWQRIKGAASSALTDQFGNFQTEVGEGDVIYVQNRSKTCTAAMPPFDSSNEIFSYVGDILCI